LSVAGCGDDSGGDSPANARPSTPADGDPVRIVARSAHVGRGREDIRLVRIPRVGRLLVSCDAAALSSTAFRLGDRTATSDIIVQRGDQVADSAIDPGERFTPGFGGFEDGIETWRIAFFAKAQAAIATITVAARQLGAEEPEGCAISADARIFQSTRGTLTP
jgi:hypothetical protein